MSEFTQPLPVRLLLAYGLSALPLSTLAVGMFIILPTVYAESSGIAMAQLALLVPLTRSWDVVSDPLIGWLSDRTRSRFGRRRPWVLIAWLPLSVAIYALYLPPDGVGPFYLLGWSIVFFTAGTMLFMPYTVWGAELSDDYHQRSRVFAYRHVFAAIGTLLAAALAWLARDGGTNAFGAPALELIAWTGLAVLPITLLFLFLFVPERPVPRPVIAVQPRQPLRAGFAVILANRPFRLVLLSYFCNGMANAFPATLFFFFVRHRLDSPGATGMLLSAYFLAAIIGTPIWLKISHSLGKHRAWFAAMLLAAAAFVFVPFVGPGQITAFLAIIVVAGLTLGADLSMPGAMLADVVDQDTLASGRRRAGIFFALWAMVAKAALALAVGISFWILDASGFDAYSDDNPPLALLALAILFGILPVGFKLVAAALAWRYPITAERQQALQKAIAAGDIASSEPAG